MGGGGGGVENAPNDSSRHAYMNQHGDRLERNASRVVRPAETSVHVVCIACHLETAAIEGTEVHHGSILGIKLHPPTSDRP